MINFNLTYDTIKVSLIVTVIAFIFMEFTSISIFLFPALLIGIISGYIYNLYFINDIKNKL